MISVAGAERTVRAHTKSFGRETIRLESAAGRVLAENIYADRDLPPYDRVTMDGYAIKHTDYKKGRRTFSIQATQAAGQPPGRLTAGRCIQIATGAVLPDAADTVVPMEGARANDGIVTVVTEEVRQGQYVHRRGSDIKRGRLLIPAGQVLSAAAVSLAASAGRPTVAVSRLPRVAVITTGDELVDILASPSDYQIRQSNNYAAQAALGRYGVSADLFHLPDDLKIMRQRLDRCLGRYDAVIISGGVSKGAFDYVPAVLVDLSVKLLFHGVKQKPGKPLLFGARPDGPVVFGCPGNPVSTLLCLYKYFIPWLRACLGAQPPPALYAVLDQAISPPKGLHMFCQVKLQTDKAGVLRARPIVNSGSGDILSLLPCDGFLELPAGEQLKRGHAYKLLPLTTIM